MTPPTASGTEEYRKSKKRDIATGYEVTYEMLTGDLSNVNFSSWRGGWIEHQRVLDHAQWMTLIPTFCKRVFKWFLEQVPLIPGSPISAIPADLTTTWTAPRREMLDPVKETNAKKLALENRLIPWSEIVKGDGYNPEEVLAQMQKDEAAFKKVGITPPWVAQPKAAGQPS